MRRTRAVGRVDLKLCVLGTGTVAAFAGDAEHKLRLAIDIAFVGFGLEVGGVAFHAAGANGAVEDGSAVRESGTVDPLAAGGPIRDRELIEPVALPIQIGLADFARAGDDFHSLAVLVQFVVLAHDIGRLVKTVGAGTHFEPQIVVAGPHECGLRGKVAGDGVRVGQARSNMVSGLYKTFVFVRMAALAGGGADIGVANRYLLFGLWALSIFRRC